ncbi:short-chain dehydrogenase, partial [Salmonella enterica subsp. enterica serovar Mississippi]|nr:short-chain dehydrogenase [Salmonella enterica subsp. enterica serovar Mississippi]
MTQPDDNAATVSPQRVLITGVTSGLGEQLAHDYL